MSILKKIKKYFNLQKKRDFYSVLIRPGETCFDIGANTGEKTALFLSLGARVIAAEPQQDCIPALEKLKKKFDSRLTIVPKAVADKEGKAVMNIGCVSQVSTLSEEFMAYFGKNGELTWEKKETVEVTTLDLLIAEFGTPAFCKIDTEGMEKKVFDGLSSKIGRIEFEFTPPFIHETKDCLELLSRFGPVYFNYNKYEQPFFEMKRWCDKAGMLSALENIPRNIVHGNIFVKYPE